MEPGEFVNLYLIDPIEKIWGRLVSIDSSGVVVRGVDVKMIETFRYQFQKEERETFPQTSFWPMRRVQRIDLDEAMDDLPSIIQSLVESTGLEIDDILPLPSSSAD